MSDQPPQLVPLDPQRDEQEPHERGLLVDLPRAALVRGDEVRLGMQIGNLIWAAVHGVEKR